MKDEKIISQSTLSSLRYFVKNSVIEMRRRFCYYLLALVSVTVVVCAAQITQTITDRAQVIYLQAGEQQNGQIDIRITSSIDYIKIPFEHNRKQDNALLNYDQIYKRLESVNLHKFSTGRNVFEVNMTIVSQANGCEITNSTDLILYPQIKKKCTQFIKSDLIFIDTQKEINVGIGRLYEESEIPEEQVVISRELATLLNIKEGDTLLVTLNPNIYIFYIVEKYCQDINLFKSALCNQQYFWIQHANLAITAPFQVFKIAKNIQGKASYESLKTALLMEKKHLLKTIYKYSSAQLIQTLTILTKEIIIEDFNPDNYVSEVIVNFPNRLELYTKYNFDYIEMQGNFYSSQISKALGVYPVQIELPIMEIFHKLKYASMFLSIVTNMIIILFSSLSIMMLYNLLLVSVETKTYELGVLRIIGLNKYGVIGMIFSQSLSFVIPGVVLGILIAVQLLKFINQKSKELVGIEIEQTPSLNSYALCLTLGILIPLASSIIPIKRALSNTLSFALDRERSKSQAVKITIDVEGEKTNWGQISVGLLCTLFGFSIYYLLPLSLFTMDLGLLISIFFFILIGLLVGLILIAINFAYLFERLVVLTCFFWMGSSTKKIVLKNLASHRIKNTRSSLMYGLSIAFVIFVWSAMSLQVDSQYYSKLKDKGANFVFQNNAFPSLNANLCENIFLNDLKDVIQSYTLVAESSKKSLAYKGVDSIITIKNKGRMVQLDVNFVGVQPNYLKTVNLDYLKIEKKSESGLDIVEELYTSSEVAKMIISKEQAETLFYTTDIDLDNENQENELYVEVRNGQKTNIFKFQVSAIVSSFPGMSMSYLNIMTESSIQKVIVSLPTFYSLVEDTPNDESIYMYDTVIIKADLDHYDLISNKITTIINQQDAMKGFWSFKSSKEELEQNMQLIDLIFSGLGSVVMVLCFFSLISSMTSNIYEQTKEIAVLRAIGISKIHISLIYVYESFVLVFSSCIMGTLVGLIIGYSMSMQRQLFTNMIINFRFPWAIFKTQLIISIICAFGSTILPITHLVRQPISTIIRKTY